jgi:hypothetical protein
MKWLHDQILREKDAEKSVQEEEELLKEQQDNDATCTCDKISAERKADEGDTCTADDSDEELSQQFCIPPPR